MTTEGNEDQDTVAELTALLITLKEHSSIFCEDLVFEDLEQLLNKLRLSTQNSVQNSSVVSRAERLARQKAEDLAQRVSVMTNNHLEESWITYANRKKGLPLSYKEQLKAIEEHFITQLLPFFDLIYQRVKDKIKKDSFIIRMGQLFNTFFQSRGGSDQSVKKIIGFLPVLANAISLRDQQLERLEQNYREELITKAYDELTVLKQKICEFLTEAQFSESVISETVELMAQIEAEVLSDFRVAREEVKEAESMEGVGLFLKGIEEKKQAINELFVRTVKKESRQLCQSLDELINSRVTPTLFECLIVDGSMDAKKLLAQAKKRIIDKQDENLEDLFPVEFNLLTRAFSEIDANERELRLYLRLLLKQRWVLNQPPSFIKAVKDTRLIRSGLVRQELGADFILEKEELAQSFVVLKEKITEIRQTREETAVKLSNEEEKTEQLVIEIKKRKAVFFKLMTLHSTIIDKVNQLIELNNSCPLLGIHSELYRVPQVIEPNTQEIFKLWSDYKKAEKRFDFSVENLELLKGRLILAFRGAKTKLNNIVSTYKELSIALYPRIERELARCRENFYHDHQAALSVFDEFPQYTGEREKALLNDFISYKNKLIQIREKLEREITSLNISDQLNRDLNEIIIIKDLHNTLFQLVKNNKNKPWARVFEQLIQTLIPGEFTPPFDIDLQGAKEKLIRTRAQVLRASKEEVYALYQLDKNRAVEFLADLNNVRTSFREDIERLEHLLPFERELDNVFFDKLAGRIDCDSIISVKTELLGNYLELAQKLSYLVDINLSLSAGHTKFSHLVSENVGFVSHMKKYFSLDADKLEAFLIFTKVRSSLDLVDDFESLVNYQEEISLQILESNQRAVFSSLNDAIETLKSYEAHEKKAYTLRQDAFLEKMLGHARVFIWHKPLSFFSQSVSSKDYSDLLDSYLNELQSPLNEKWFKPSSDLLEKAEEVEETFNQRLLSEEVRVVSLVLNHLKEEYGRLQKEDYKDKRLALLTNCHDEILFCLHQYCCPPEKLGSSNIIHTKEDFLINLKNAVKRTLYGKGRIEALSEPESKKLIYFCRRYLLRPLIDLLVNNGVMSEHQRAISVWGASPLEAKVSSDARKLLSLNTRFFPPGHQSNHTHEQNSVRANIFAV